MKKLLSFIFFFFTATVLFAQTDTSGTELSPKESRKLMKKINEQIDFESMEEASLNRAVSAACTCIDSVLQVDLSTRESKKAVSACIQDQASAVNLMSQLLKSSLELGKKRKKKDRTININLSEEGSIIEYQKIENGLVDSCQSLKGFLAASNADASEKSFSDNERARYYYNLGEEAFKKKDYDKSIDYYKQSLDIDENSAWAWDNLGLAYRYKNNYKKAIECYTKSLEIDPDGTMPLQNIAVAYSFMEDYDKAEKAYGKIIKKFPEDPEGYFGKGRILLIQNKQEQGLDMLCKAYNLYTVQKNPYRADAQKMITYVYIDMKKTRAGKKKFLNILEANKIDFKVED